MKQAIILLALCITSVSFAESTPSLSMAIQQGEWLVGKFEGNQAERSVAIGLIAAGQTDFNNHSNFLCKVGKKTTLCEGVLTLNPKAYFKNNENAAHYFAKTLQRKAGLPVTASAILEGDYRTFGDIVDLY